MLKSNSPKLNFTISFPIQIPQIPSSQIIKKSLKLEGTPGIYNIKTARIEF